MGTSSTRDLGGFTAPGGPTRAACSGREGGAVRHARGTFDVPRARPGGDPPRHDRRRGGPSHGRTGGDRTSVHGPRRFLSAARGAGEGGARAVGGGHLHEVGRRERPWAYGDQSRRAVLRRRTVERGARAIRSRP